MSRGTFKVPKILRDELDASGLPWTVEPGTKHGKLLLAGQFVGVIPRNARKDSQGGRGGLNVRSEIRKIIKAHQEQKECS
jgi:hypothetical protein